MESNGIFRNQFFFPSLSHCQQVLRSKSECKERMRIINKRNKKVGQGCGSTRGIQPGLEGSADRDRWLHAGLLCRSCAGSIHRQMCAVQATFAGPRRLPFGRMSAHRPTRYSQTWRSDRPPPPTNLYGTRQKRNDRQPCRITQEPLTNR